MMRARAARSPSLSVATRPDHLLEPLGDDRRAHPRPPWPHRRPRASRPRRASVVWGNTHFLNCSRRLSGEGVYSQLTPKAMESSKKLARVLSHCLLDPKTVENGSVGRQLTCAYPTSDCTRKTQVVRITGKTPTLRTAIGRVRGGERSSFGRIWSDFTHLGSCGIATGLNPGLVPPETVLSHRISVYSHLQFRGRGPV